MPFFECSGYTLHYREQGHGDLLVILPGNTASSACHDGELTHLSERYHAVALDYLGTGKSDRLATWPDSWWRDGADQALALADYLGAEELIAVGTSGGAVVALWLAILYPERVRAVVADSTLSVFPPELVAGAIEERAQRTEGQVGFWSYAHGDDWARVVDADTDLVRRLGERGGDWLDGRIAEVRCPALITGSLRDDAIPGIAADNAAMVDAMTHARLYLHPEGGHPLMWSQPQAFRDQVDLFLAGLTSP